MLNTLRLTKNTLSGGCENKEMVQLGVDGSDVKALSAGSNSRIRLKDSTDSCKDAAIVKVVSFANR